MNWTNSSQCRMMDNVGLDTVSFIENHYVTERHLDKVHLDWLNKNYVDSGILGKKTPGKGGLYPLPPPGSQTQLIFLNIGTAEPYDDKLSISDMQVREIRGALRNQITLLTLRTAPWLNIEFQCEPRRQASY